VRQKYKDHVGRELTADEREQINKLVLDFVKNLAVEQTVRIACLYVSEIGHIQYSLYANKMLLVLKKVCLSFYWVNFRIVCITVYVQNLQIMLWPICSYFYLFLFIF